MSDRWLSIALSVLLHGTLLAAFLYGWMMFRQSPREVTLAIEASVIEARAVRGALLPPPVAQAPPEPVGPPPPTAQELAQREQQRREAQAAATERQLAEQQAAAAQAEEQRRAEERRRAAEEQRQRQEEAREASEREADLQRNLAAEEHAKATRSGPALANWQAQIAAKINRKWLRPPTARPGIECVLNVTQVPGGDVTQVNIGACNGDQAVRESIEAAVYRASPLPPPPDPALFDRNLRIDFKPD